MDISAISSQALDIQALLDNKQNTAIRNGSNDTVNKTADYAKKGEPMYMADMDSDEDGTVTLDEFRDYCKSKGIGANQMVKMSQMASSYRTIKAEAETIDYISKLTPNVFPKINQADSSSPYVKQNDNKFNISNDTNSDNKVAYKEYMNFCEQNASSHELKSYTKAEETSDGNLIISNLGKAMQAYKFEEANFVKNTFEEVV